MSYQGSAKDYFFEEAREHLDTLESGLMQIEADGGSKLDMQCVDVLFRSAHTLKGASALLKYNHISQIAHDFESLLEDFKNGIRDVSEGLIDAMLKGVDAIRFLLQEVDKPDYARTAADVQIKFDAVLHSALDAAEDSKVQTELNDDLEFTQYKDIGGGTVKVDIDQIDAMMDLLGEITVNKSHLLEQVSYTENMKDEIDFARDRLLREVRLFSDRHEYTTLEDKSGGAGAKSLSELAIADFDELEFDRYDELNLFSRKLQEISNDINEALGEIHGFLNSLSVDVEAMDRMTGEMKERISVIRTVPVEQLYQRFRRTFRNMSHEDKSVSAELILEGGDTRIGRTVIDGLFDPMVHLLRNALAHGIETDAERTAAGKPASGQIRITTRRRGNSAIITIADDGRGIQLDKVRQKAIELGWLEQNSSVERQELLDIIFRPGFSTKAGADELSGRGVGMDVVLDRLSTLNGTIDVVSEEGKGTSFVLHIPLSLVIVNVIQFRVGKQLYVIPTALVEEIQDVSALDVVDQHVVRQNERYRIVDLNECFALPEEDASRRCILFVKTMGARLGLQVEEVLSQEDTVIRSFGRLLESMRCFSGTSVSGGGDIRLVINPSRLVDVIDLRPHAHGSAAEPGLDPDSERGLRVLVVDDSLSVRKYASLILEGNNIDVLTAVNGQNALEVLDTESVDLVLTDLEMPVMHGYELLAEIKRRPDLKSLPVLVITSRASEQHRQKAVQMGASGYLVKPFDEQTLLSSVREYSAGNI